VHALKQGTLPNASIDVSGDYIRGGYVENGKTEGLTTAPGLAHYTAERDRVQGAVAAADDAVTRYQERIGRLKGLLASYQAQQAAATAAIQTRRDAGAAAADDLLRLSDEAIQAENSAVAKFGQSATAYGAASTAAGTAVRDAADAMRVVSPENTDMAAASIVQDDTWVAAHIDTEQAAAESAAAWQHYQQYQNETANADLLASAAVSLELDEAVATARRDLATDAQTAGLASARSATEKFQRAHGKLGKSWTVVAEYAGAAYLLVLLGEPQHLKDVVANYRNAIASREAEGAAAPFKDRLAKLEKMK